MRKSTILAAFAGALGLLLVTGCVTGRLPMPEQLVRSGAVPQGADLASLKKGRAVMITSCTECHRFYWPHEYRPDEWREILPDMAGRSSLSEEQTENITRYILLSASGSEARSPVK